MNKKGQALVEFIMIIPIFLLIMLSMIDFGNILLKKYQLESDMDHIVQLYNDHKIDDMNKYLNEKGLTVNYNQNKMIINKKIEVTTPGLRQILGNPYYVETSRSLYE